eukprot:Lithocolla_globosa_v1_NODE_4715_length_1381_cov_116.150075.p3 type:complete len:112 gc:universal NODE_4715_length_1381_cov_116.150075:1126-791(-)
MPSSSLSFLRRRPSNSNRSFLRWQDKAEPSVERCSVVRPLPAWHPAARPPGRTDTPRPGRARWCTPRGGGSGCHRRGNRCRKRLHPHSPATPRWPGSLSPRRAHCLGKCTN